MTVDLATSYCGLKLTSPLLVGSSPLCGEMDFLRCVEDAGAGAAVLPSLFQEQIQRTALETERLYELQSDAYGDTVKLLRDLDYLNHGARGYLRLIEQCKQSLRMPIIASLNAHLQGEWTSHARLIAEAGADALELDIYFLPGAEMSSQQVEDQYIDLVAAVRAEISIPLAVKISPYFTALPQFARRLVDAGADALVLFSRYLPPDVDVGKVAMQPSLELSDSQELRLPLRWVAILHDHVTASLAATSGIQQGSDVVKVLLMGGDAAMVTSALFRQGPRYVHTLLEQLTHWLEEHGYDSVRDMRGLLGRLAVGDPTAVARLHDMRALLAYAAKAP